MSFNQVKLPKIELKDHEQVYPPAEDSELMQRVICSGIITQAHRILDMCTGSGIQAITAAKQYPNAKIVAADHNKYAVELASENTRANGAARVEVIRSDLFANVEGTFDLIICNPPYLPAHRLDPDDLLNTALVGGKKGNEVILKFLAQATTHLAEHGSILLLFSSLSNKDIIDVYLQEKLYISTVLACDYVGGFESLYVYKLQRLPQIAALENYGVQELGYLAKGKRGIILGGKLDGERVAVKIAHNRIQAAVIAKESIFLKKANKWDIGPRLIASTEQYIIMDFIDGEPITEYLQKASRKDAIHVLKEILEQLYLLDKHGIQKLEMTNPYKHILVTKDKKVVLLDFERSQFATYPKNITQFMQYLQSDRFNDKKFITKSQEEIVALMQEYKFAKTNTVFQKIIALLK